jgi:ribosomal protein S27AE
MAKYRSPFDAFLIEKNLLVNPGEFDYKKIMPNKASPSSSTRQFLSTSGQPNSTMKPAHTSRAEQEKQENWWDFCPICGSKLLNHKCRFVCSNLQCHFFMSCSEFDL